MIIEEVAYYLLMVGSIHLNLAINILNIVIHPTLPQMGLLAESVWFKSFFYKDQGLMDEF